MSKTKRLVYAGLCVALGVVLPMAFHSVPNGGSVFLPMHIPVLLCGFLCGPWYGLAAGVLTPLISSTTGMPPAAVLPGMMCELAVYGLVSGLAYGAVHTKSRTADIYISLAAAMLAGRAVSGLVNSFLFRAGQYSLQMWAAASFVRALPGIAIQLVVLPALVYALERAGILRDAAPRA